MKDVQTSRLSCKDCGHGWLQHHSAPINTLVCPKCHKQNAQLLGRYVTAKQASDEHRQPRII